MGETASDIRPFPIQEEGNARTKLERCFVPWWLAEAAYADYSLLHDQPLETIARRGGFGRGELLFHLAGGYAKKENENLRRMLANVDAVNK